MLERKIRILSNIKLVRENNEVSTPVNISVLVEQLRNRSDIDGASAGEIFGIMVHRGGTKGFNAPPNIFEFRCVKYTLMLPPDFTMKYNNTNKNASLKHRSILNAPECT